MLFKEKLQRLKEELQYPTIGKFGEILYACHMKRNKYIIESQHHDNTDFVVNNIRVDVKSRFDNKINPIVEKNRIKNVTYAYVVFDVYDVQSTIKIYDDTQTLLGEYTPEEVAEIVGTFTLPKSTNKLTTNRKSYWKNKFRNTCKIVYRSSASTTQTSMGKQGWGPEAFYEKSKKYKYVVCIYENNGVFHHAEAYPMTLQHDINFYPVSKVFKGKPAGRMTYNPNELDKKFIFTNEETLEHDIVKRFPV